MDSTIFSYQPLTSTTMIRLLKLHQQSDDEEIRSSLEFADLDDQDLDYEALSYCWGPPVLCRRLRVGEAYLGITQNLHDALERLQLPTEDRMIWVDAICIDQNSVSEKNHQVGLMSRIYTQCSTCIVYLGPEADSSELILAS